MLEIGSELRIHSSGSGIMVGRERREGSPDPDGGPVGMSPESLLAAVLTASIHHRNEPGPAISLPPWSCLGGRARDILVADSDQGILRVEARLLH